MRTLIFSLLFYGLHSFAADSSQSRTYECKNEKGFERRLEVQYQTGQAVPCRTIFYRMDVAKGKVEHVLMSAAHQSGKCEKAEKDYLMKMKKWNVKCELITAKTEEAVKPQTPVAVAPKEEPSKPVQEVSKRGWAGAYAGVVLGAQFGHSSDKTGSFGYNGDNEKWDYSESGLNAAAEWGYNYLWQGLVVGPEVEIGYLGMNGNGAQPSSPGFDTIGKNSSDLYAALRARAGMDFNLNLIFVTGGVMSVNSETKLTDNCAVAPCGGSTVDAGKKAWLLGSVVGLGVEHLSLDGWSVKLEYLYFSLGNQNFSGTTNLGNTYDWTAQTTGSVLRGGLNFWY